MSLSEEVQSLLQRFKVLSKTSQESLCSDKLTLPAAPSEIFFDPNDLINVNAINFDNEETWLYESACDSGRNIDVKKWLNQDVKAKKDLDFHSTYLSMIREMAKIDSKQKIDSRTFTRPKKRYNRPSIKHYNDGDDNRNVTIDNGELLRKLAFKEGGDLKVNKSLPIIPIKFGIDRKDEDDIGDYHDGPAMTNSSETRVGNLQRLSFDLSQPITNTGFDKMLAAAPELDSFQNMSPPSLVNSMCSSTFTNLMENSYIKNDPVLREIRDADYSDIVTLQDVDCQSFTESCSSLNSDVAESFVRKTLGNTFLNGTRDKSKDDSDCVKSLNDTYICRDDVITETFVKDSSEGEDFNSTISTGTIVHQQNNTYSKNNDPHHIINTNTTFSATFRKKSPKLNATFLKSPKNASSDSLDNQVIDTNRTVIIEVDNLNESTKLKNHTNLKRMSYVIDKSVSDESSNRNLKRHSVGYPAGSADSLDQMSSLSNSSKGSNKMLNMAEIDAIVEQQEQSLKQVMSTPNPSREGIDKLWESNLLSPIIRLDHREPLSDSELSSDDYATVHSSLSKLSLTSDVSLTNKESRSLENLPVEPIKPQSNLKALISKTAQFRPKTYGGSYSNLKMIGQNLKGSSSNLKAVGLKGSYTNLKPMFHAKPDIALHPMGKPKVVIPTTIKSGLQQPQQHVESTSSLIRPQVRASGLPRPVVSTTGIPRPASRIPGPRTVRPVLVRPNRPTKLNDGYY